MINTKLTRIFAREILDSRGNPTVKAYVGNDELLVSASVPSGASTGKHEALELRDGVEKRYFGKGVRNAVRNVNNLISKNLEGMDFDDQKKIDDFLINLDGTENKSRLGANAILAVSLAVSRLSAQVKGEELFYSLAKKYGYFPKKIPIPMMNVINGGMHAGWVLDFQEFMILPMHKNFSERLRMGVTVYAEIKDILKKMGFSLGVGDEGGFAVKLEKNLQALDILKKAVQQAGFEAGKEIGFALDVAASELYSKDIYNLKIDKSSLDYKALVKFYEKIVKKYPVVSIEDGCAEDDFVGWKLLTQKLGKKIMLVGDDLFVTNPKRLKEGIQEGYGNSLLVKPNQIGTLSETMSAIKLAQDNGYKVIVSHRSGETEDSYIADLSVAVGAEFIKTGGLSRSERIAKYNRLLEIEAHLEK